MRFADIVGLDEAKHTLVRAIQTDHVAHAQLFLSNPGGGALALALAYATLVNCEAREPDSTDACGTCPSCYKFGKLLHPDLHFVFPTATTKKVAKREDAISQAFLPEWREFLLRGGGLYASLSDWSAAVGAENKQCIIPVAEGRNIIRDLSLKAFEARYKIMLIWLPELMNVNAANAILKVLEEPPEQTLFLMASQSLDSMLPTILSRTQLVAVRPFADPEVKQFLVKEFALPETQAHDVAVLADGSLGEARRLAEGAVDTSQERFRDWMRLCFRMDVGALVKEADKFNGLDKEEQKGLLQYSLTTLRESLLFRYAGEQLLRLEASSLEFVRNFSKVLNERNADQIAQKLNEAYAHIERNASPRIVFLDLSLQVAQLFKVK